MYSKDSNLNTLIGYLNDGLSDKPYSTSPNIADYIGLRKARQYSKAFKLRLGLLESWQQLHATEKRDIVVDDEINKLKGLLTPGKSVQIEKRQVKKDVEATLSKLLDACDLLAEKERDTAIRCSLDYHANGRTWRARKLLRNHLREQPHNTQAISSLVAITREDGKLDRALDYARRGLSDNPQNGELRYQHALTLLQDLNFNSAIAEFDQAIQYYPTNEVYLQDLTKAKQLKQWNEDAKIANAMPGIELDEQEIRDGTFHPATLALATRLFREYGTLYIGNAFNCQIIENCRKQFIAEYQEFFTHEKPEGALQIGDRRYQVTVSLKGAFNQPELYANPFVITLMKALLNENVILGSAICATSLPGSSDQHLHKDHRALFTAGVDDDPIDLPPVAITTMVPLVSLDEKIGTTQVKKGSHRLSRSQSAKLPTQTPLVPVGSCFLMDLALSHKGQGNQTGQIRPILNMVYHQHWFADNKNFHEQPPLRIPESELRQVPSQHLELFEWIHQPGVDLSDSQ